MIKGSYCRVQKVVWFPKLRKNDEKDVGNALIDKTIFSLIFIHFNPNFFSFILYFFTCGSLFFFFQGSLFSL
jgi:hypothetical protein